MTNEQFKKEASDMNRVLYLRLERPSTDSFMTYRLPEKMVMGHAVLWAEQYLIGWGVISGSLFNPDEEMANYGYD